MFTCYYCKEFKNIKVPLAHDYFCNEAEHQLWADKHYPVQKYGKKSIEEIQKKLLEFGAKAGVKVGETKPLFKDSDNNIV